ncbi:hypothetical protein B7494_g1731 [Chlorociboria aeruginascens]|nr:hypothetical protein B7494_g1731 [Chlorociboria aeruginascens]
MASSLVFITGGTGFIGSQVIRATLNAGYRVRLSIRKPEQAEKITKLYPGYTSKIETVIVPDTTKTDAFKSVLNDASYIFHLASPMPGKGSDVKTDYVKPAVQGTEQILYAALNYPQIKKVIVMSSCLALMPVDAMGRKENFVKDNTGEVIPVDLDMSFPAGLTGHGIKYAASKILAHQATRDFLVKENPHYDLITLHPTFVLGHNLVQESAQGLDGVNGLFWMSLFSEQQPLIPSAWVHVQDVADAHIKLLDTPVESGKEFILSEHETFPWEEAVDFIKAKYPNLGIKIKPPFEGEWKVDITVEVNDIFSSVIVTSGYQIAAKPSWKVLMADHLVESKRQKNVGASQHTPTKRQIKQRLTQRQYRARKENGISLLRNRVDLLESVIDEATEGVLSLCDILLDSDILLQYPHVTSALHLATRNCLSLARANHPESTTEEPSQGMSDCGEIESTVSDLLNEECWWTGVFANTITQINGDSKGASSMRQSSNLVLDTPPPSQISETQQVINSARRISSLPPTNSTPPILISFPGLLAVYHKAQSAFTQALIRACFWNGYRLLSSSSTNSEIIMQVFGNQFTPIDRVRMASLLRSVLIDKEGNSVHIQTRMHHIKSDQDVLDSYSVQRLLWERGISIDGGLSCVRVQNKTGFSVFDARSFITFLSEVPICAGNEPVFQRCQVEAALSLAIVS